MKALNIVFALLRNKYVLAAVVFLVWISFFDRNDLFTQYDRKKELNKLEESAAFYSNEIASTKVDLSNLNNNSALLEKMAREKFYLKRPNEEIFIVDTVREEKK